MRKFVRILLAAAALLIGAASVSLPASAQEEPAAQKKAKVQLEAVVFQTNLHCAECVKKVMENISFEKGVKDLEVSLEQQTITVTFNPSKTSVETLQKAINKLGYNAEPCSR